MSEPLPTGLAIGQRIGKYLLTDKLGEGGMGVVFGGVHEALGRNVAIKVLRAEFAKNEQVVLRFQQEAEAVSKIGHSHIVAIYDFGRLDDGSVYYVMERIEGETLTDRLTHAPPVTAQETVNIFTQICRALTATHARNIVHRDLKPDNVLIQSKDGGMPHVKVLDFGVAKMKDPGAAASNLTKVGALLGTPTYMAPEQITASMSVDGRADIYSLGAMLYEVLTGQPPFGRGELMSILTRHIREPVTPPSQKMSVAIPDALDAMVVKSLAKKADDRQPDAATFAAELEAALGLMRVNTQTVKPVVVAPKKSRAPMFVAAGALGLALVGGGGYFALHHGKATVESDTVKPIAVKLDPLSDEANKIVSVALAGDSQQRKAAVEALGEVGDHAALDQIITALGDENPEVRRSAASAAIAVGKRGDAQLLTALSEAGSRSGGAIAVDLSAARYRIGDTTAEEELKRALEQRDPAVRLRAAVALADGGKLPAAMLRAALAAAPPTVRRSLRWAAFALLQQLGDAAFSAELKTALTGADPVAKLDAAQTLARAKDPEGLAALSTLAADSPNPVDRVDAACVQAELGDTGALDALATALTSPLPQVRSRAATSLGRLAPLLADQSALRRQLGPLLKDSDANVRVAAAAGLLAVKDSPNKRTP